MTAETPGGGGLTEAQVDALTETYRAAVKCVQGECDHCYDYECAEEWVAAAVRAHLLSDAVVERAAGAHWEAWSFNHASRLGINDAAEHGRAMVRAALAAAVGSDTDG
jgi:hypothetical protein